VVVVAEDSLIKSANIIAAMARRRRTIITIAQRHRREYLQ